MTASTNDPITMAVAATDAITADSTPSQDPSSDVSVTKSTGEPKPVTKNVAMSMRLRLKKFEETFGKFGYVMVMIFLFSTIWTLVLAMIQVRPAAIANGMMNTTNYDQGEFWLLPVPLLHIEVLAVIALLLFAIGYLGLVALMLFPNQLCPVRQVKPRQRPMKKVMEATSNSRDGSKVTVVEGGVDPVAIKLKLPTAAPEVFTLARLKYEMFSPHGLLRHYYSALMDGPKLIFQTTTLLMYLNNGFPIVIIYVYSSLLFINWVMSAYRYQSRHPDPHYILPRIFYSFDLFFAVFAPLEVLLYAYFNFDFDRAEFQTRIDAIAPGSYDNTARLFADPDKVSVFRIAFNYLHFSDIESLLIKSALNVLSLYKWKKTIVHLIEHSRQPSVDHEKEKEIKASKTQEWREHIQNIVIALIFFLAGLGIFIYSIVAVETTRHVCHPHPQCIIPSYQWNVGSEYCSCLVFVDRDMSLKTFHEWENPPDTSANLAALAMTGHLTIIQIINRAVPQFPIELRNCTNLEQVILIYTETTRFPEWMSEFTHLEYLHIEGDFTQRRMSYMPLDMFKNMPKLSFIHFGVLVDLPEIPDLTRLHNLRYLTMAFLHSVHTPPDLSGLTRLKTLIFVDSINLQTLPSISSLTSLQSFFVVFRQPSCCNGFLTKGVCDLNNFSCKPRTGEPLVQCSTTQWPEENWDQLKTVPIVRMCEPGLTFDIKDGAPSVYTTDIQCGGIKYKQCSLGGMIGICYNTRMTVITCDITGQYEQLRRLQIMRKVGPPCDPTVEAWLGCQ